MARAVSLDRDVENRIDFCHKKLIEVFGEEVAAELIAEEDDDFVLDKDLQEIVDGAGTLEDYK